MIATEIKKTHTASGVIKTGDFSVKGENLATIFHILRNQLYKDPQMAVLREYSCNAVDANVEAGNGDKPIEVYLPTALKPTLRIRDFGPGLSEERVFDVYVSYGASSKRDTNDAIGMLGLGSKSAFAYVDSYLIISYHGGKKTTYTAFIDPSQIGKVSKMSEEDSTEPTGIEIIVPVKNADINSFYERAKNLYVNFKVTPKITGWGQYVAQAFLDLCAKKYPLSGDGWAYTESGSSFAIMGSIAYPIDWSSFGANDLTGQMKNLLNGGININFSIGDLEIAASREALQYTEVTRKALISKIRTVANEIQKRFDDEVAKCKTEWDARIFANSIQSLSSPFYGIKNFISQKVVFNGKEIVGRHYDFQKYQVTPPIPVVPNGVKVTSAPVQTEPDLKLSIFSKSGFRVSGGPTNHVIPAEPAQLLVVENDLNLKNGISNRIVPLIEDVKTKSVLLMTFADDAAKKRVITETGLDCEIIKISTLPVVPLRKYYGTSQKRNMKHMSKIFTLDRGVKKSYGIKNSDYWKEVDANFDADDCKGLYVPIDRFSYQDASHTWRDSSRLIETIAAAEKCGITIGTVYGVKPSSIDIVKKNTDMVNLFTYLTDKIKELVKKNGDALSKTLTYNTIVTDSVVSHFFKHSTSYNGVSGLIDDLVKFIKETKAESSKASTSFEDIRNLGGFMGRHEDPPAAATSKDWRNEITKVYPLASAFIAHVGEYQSSRSVNTLVEYVKMVETTRKLNNVAI